MAVTFTDTFTGAEDSTLEGRTGWTTSGVFPVDAQGLKLNASNQVKNTSGNGCLAYVDSGSADSYAQALMYGPLFASTLTAICVRCVDYNNFVGIRPWTSTTAYFFKMVGGVYTAIGAAVEGLSLVVGQEWRLEVEGDTLRWYLDDVQMGGDRDITGVLSGSKTGLYAANTAVDPVFDTFEAGTIGVANIITITEESDRKVYAHVSGASNKVVSGTYVGSPTEIEYRVEDYDSGSVISGHDWQTLDASPSGGTYSGTINLPKGDWYKVLTRWSNDNSVSSETTSRFGVGFVVENAGQSNAVSQFTSGSVVTADDRTSIFDGVSLWTLPLGQHAISWMNQLAQNEGCVVGAFDTAAGSSSIVAHLSGGGNYPTRQNYLTAAGGDVNLMLWTQGEADASGSMSQAVYESHLATLYTDILTRTGRVAADCPMFIVVTGREDGEAGNDSGWQDIRQAQKAFADTTTGVFISAEAVALGMEDSLHYDTASKASLSTRIGQSIINYLGHSAYDGRGPIVSAIQWGGSTIEIDYNLNGSSSVVLSGLVTGHDVSNDDFSSTENISSSSSSGNKVTLTMSSPLSGTVKVRSMYGQDPDVANIPVGTVLTDAPAFSMTLPVTGLEVSSPTFTGSIADQSGSVTDAISLDVSSNWTESPNNYQVTSGALPDGLSLSNSGVISGSLTTGQTNSGIVITASNLAGGAVSNAFEWVVISPDDVPDSFTFNAVSNAEPSTTNIESNAVTISGINIPSAISIVGGEYAVDSGGGFGPFTSAPGTISNSNQVKLRTDSSASFSALTSATLTVGGVSDAFEVTTRAGDTTPDPFAFVDQTDVPVNFLIASNAVTITGIEAASNVTVLNGEYSIEGGGYTTSPGSITNGQQVSVRHVSSAFNSTDNNTILTVGGVSDTFTSTTIAGGGGGGGFTDDDRDTLNAIQADIAALNDFDPNTAIIEGSETWLQAMRLIRADAAGSIADDDAGNYVIKSADGLKDRITGTYADSSRTITGTDVT